MKTPNEGEFRYVQHHLVFEFNREGWMIADDFAGTYHGHFSVLMWRCSCFVEVAPDPMTFGGYSRAK